MRLEFSGEIWFWRGPAPWETSLWPKDGRYVVPVKTQVRRAEGLEEGDVAEVVLVVDVRD